MNDKNEKANKRNEEFNKIVSDLDEETLILLNPLIDNLIFLENQLNYLKTLPFIIVKEDDPRRQKTTPAYKQYKDLSQTYINALKVINGALGIESENIESPLRLYIERRLKEQNE